MEPHMKSTFHKFFFAVAFAATTLSPSIARADALPAGCPTGTLPHGAKFGICVPPVWNGALVVFAHGYVSSFPPQPVDFHNLTTFDGTSVPVLAMSLGYAFATTSYRKNGLAILEGVEDMVELVAQAGAALPHAPARIYVVGVSEGGLVAALLAERSPALFMGALSMCGPIGNFQAQIDYFGDFRVLFDYYFPHLLPGSAVNVPPELMAGWTTTYAPLVAAAITNPPSISRTLELLRVAKAPFDPSKPETIVETVLGILSYNVFATNDAIATLGGNPYGNRFRWYFGSSNDFALNFGVQRFTESQVARAALVPYQTSGDLVKPMVTLHTTGDPIIPVWHELLYWLKADAFARTQFKPLVINRYGHCTFTTAEVLFAFGVATQQK
jgi:pimeloyl-ACP methyl ester carboxylesterase